MNNYRYLFIGLLIMTIFVLLVRGINWYGSDNEIYFSDFLTQLEQGQVRSVVLKGNQISGDLIDQSRFVTRAPSDFILASSEENLVNRFVEQGIKFTIEESTGNPWYWILLANWGPFLFLIAVWIYFFRRNNMLGGGNNKIFNIGRSRAVAATDEDRKITFADVAGIDECKKELSEIVDFLKNPNDFSRLGGKVPKGVLMVGPPGTGKTLLAKAVAGEAGVPFYSISGSEFVEMFVGVGASRVRDLFEQARKNSPCIVFIDEIDAVGRHRGAGLGSGHDEREQTLNQLLVEMDGFDSRLGIITIAATNRVDILDPALLRPGRFDRNVSVPLPDLNGRYEILKIHTKKVKLSTQVDLNIIARGTPGFSGAELANLVNEAALHAAKADLSEVDLLSLEWARDKLMMGLERKSFKMDAEEKEITAYHEAGHAIVSAFVEKSDPVHKITIIPRGQALGLTAFLPENDKLTIDKKELLSKITVSMGGRAAEELYCNDITTGAEGDLKYSTGLAYKMVCQWGMSDKLGAQTINIAEGSFLAMDYFQGDPVSDQTQKLVDEEVRNILQNCFENARQILSVNVDKLKKLVALLLEKETVDKDEFLAIINQ